MESPLVSVIMPAYNVEKYISRGIESVLNQTYKHIELVIVDDGSNDRTYDIAKQYLTDSRVKLIRQKNSGVSSARNNALSYVSGDYLCFLDSDDWLEKEAIDILIDLQKSNKGLFICCDRFFAYEDQKGNIKKIRQRQSGKKQVIDKKTALKNIGTGAYNLQSSCYKLFERYIIDSHCLKFDTQISHGEDGLFVYRYLLCCNGLMFCTDSLWNILERAGSATTAGYNQKWLTIIESINKMKEEVADEEELIYALNNYLIDRLVLLEKEIVLSKDYKKDYRYVNTILKEVSKTEKINRTNETGVLSLFCYKYLGYNCLQLIHRIKNGW